MEMEWWCQQHLDGFVNDQHRSILKENLPSVERDQISLGANLLLTFTLFKSNQVCNAMFMVLLYLICVVLYICQSKYFKSNLNGHVIFIIFYYFLFTHLPTTLLDYRMLLLPGNQKYIVMDAPQSLAKFIFFYAMVFFFVVLHFSHSQSHSSPPGLIPIMMVEFAKEAME